MGRIYQSRTTRSRILALESQMRKQGSASILSRSGLSVPSEGVTAVDGDLQAESFVPGSAGWRLQAGGNAEFNDVTLRGGIIGNDALANPVVPGYLYASASNFSLSTTLTNILTRNVTVPDGCTQLAASVTGRVFAYNSTAGLDYLYGQVNIAGFNGFALPLAVSASGGTGTNQSPFAVLLTGLAPGSSIALQMAASTGFASWAANAGNTVELSGMLLWFR